MAKQTMTKEEALEFLRQHQPMPDDDHLGEQVIQKYDEVREYFTRHPDPACIPLFLNSFGAGDGFGVYQLVEDVLIKFPKEKVLPHLLKALASPLRSVRDWCVEIAANFPDPKLIGPLNKILQEDDPDIAFGAVTALEQIKGERATQVLQDALEKTRDKELRESILDTLSYRDSLTRKQVKKRKKAK